MDVCQKKDGADNKQGYELNTTQTYDSFCFSVQKLHRFPLGTTPAPQVKQIRIKYSDALSTHRTSETSGLRSLLRINAVQLPLLLRKVFISPRFLIRYLT